jgi:hypothetical protein
MFSEIKVKNRFLLGFAGSPIAISHGQLVQIGKKT